MSTENVCPNCGAEMARSSRSETIEHNGQSMTIQQPGLYCTGCDEVVLTTDDIRATEAEIMEFRAKADGLLSASEIADIRKNLLKISQRQAGLLLGGGPRAFQKYESHKLMVSKPMNNLLKLLAKHPEHLKDLGPQSANHQDVHL